MREPIYLREPIYIRSSAAVGGKREGMTSLKTGFDLIDKTDLFSMPSFERAEGEMARLAVNIALKKCGASHEELSFIVSGDLQNQCVASSAGLFSFGAGYIGLYGACSTFTEGLIVGSSLLSLGGGLCAVATSSHNCTAERQFRAPLEYGGQRSPSSQWTATASGAVILTSDKSDVMISALMPGKIVDGYTKDKTKMGAARALSAYDTVRTFFEWESPDEYDLILTGDLGKIGTSLLYELISENMGSRAEKIISLHRDCGNLLYEGMPDMHAGASGCGCSASVFVLDALPRLKSGEIRKMLLMSTGALMSAGSVNQGEHIFGITPLVKIELSR